MRPKEILELFLIICRGIKVNEPAPGTPFVIQLRHMWQWMGISRLCWVFSPTKFQVLVLTTLTIECWRKHDIGGYKNQRRKKMLIWKTI